MAEEEQKLLREIAFYSSLINDHYNQIPKDKIGQQQPEPRSHIEPSSAPLNPSYANVRTISNANVHFPSTTKNVSQMKMNVVSSTNSSSSALSKRIVVPALTKNYVKDNNRVVLRSSTPKGNIFKPNLLSLTNLSPITMPKLKNRTVLTSKVTSITNVNDSTIKKSGRIVLQPSRYKWTSVHPQVSLTLNKITAIPEETGRNTSNVAATQAMNKEKLNKTVVTKYTYIRGHPNTSKKSFRGVYKLVNTKTPRKSPKFVRKVGKYSIKYVVKDGKTVKRRTNSRGCYMKSFCRLVGKKYNSFYLTPTNKKRRLYNIDKTGKFNNNSGKFVEIGGILYKTSFNKLSRTDKTTKSSTRSPVVAKLNSKVSKMITVRGVKYALDSFGKTLKRVAQDSSSSYGRSRIDIGGETFIQTKPGVFVISQATKKRTMANRSVYRSINRLVAAKKKNSQYCLFFNRFGKCSKKELGTCPYIHDSEKIAVCTRFLQGNCTVENCPFSHTVCSNKMPVCTYFLRGRCTADSCPYRHVNVNPKADVCISFTKGFCSLGDQCKKLHVFSCPEFEKDGKCSKGSKCPLKHVVRKKKEKKIDEGKSQIDSARSAVQLKVMCDEEDWKRTSRLPSFIKLDDENESSENGSSSKTPLRIRPQFLN